MAYYKYRINTENDTCVINCSLTNYQYEYNFKCYSECPNQTYNDNFICKDCHPNCETCQIGHNEKYHNCNSCKNEYNNILYAGLFLNCYKICPNYSYYDIAEAKHICIDGKECPKGYDKFIERKYECIANCSQDSIYKYEYKKKCYDDCPFNSTKRENIKEIEGLPLNALYFCKPICYKELPYELVYEQECIESCDLKSILNKSCILNYKEEEKIENIKTIEIILDKIENFLTSNDYDFSDIERGNNEVMQ